MTHEELLLFGERLRNRRNVLGFTQEFVSDKAGITLRFYQMLGLWQSVEDFNQWTFKVI